MLSFDLILGQDRAVTSLRRMLDADRLAPALLFHGPEGVGKATAARALAAALLCELGPRAACGRCAACRLVAHGSHPDLVAVERAPRDGDESEDSGELRSAIGVDQIREVSRLAGRAPRFGRHRVFVVDPAERMTVEAQNALLKTLEEPPGSTVLILIASRTHLLLPTVRSRTFSLGFATLRTPELARLLGSRGMPAPEAAARAALADGRFGRALSLDIDAVRERRDELLQMLEALASGTPGWAGLPAMAASLAGKEEASLVDGLDLLQGLLRDAARAGSSADSSTLIHSDERTRLAALSLRLGAGRAASLVEATERLRDRLRLNANRLLVAESLLAAVAGGPLP